MDWHRQQRLRAIEIITYWHGRLNTGDIIAAFGISRIQASKDIKEYVSNFPDNIYYSPSDRAYLKAKDFKLHLTTGSVDEYIDHVSRMSSPISSASIERLSPHYKQLKPEVIAMVLESVRSRKGLSIAYASMTQPGGKLRTVHPHSLVDTGFRWHIRAYCDERQEFRDFNLGRIIGIPEVMDSTPKHALVSKDKQWNKNASFNLVPNPALSENQKKVVEAEFGLKNGILKISCRECLVHYLLQRYQIDSEALEYPDTSQLLAVSNPDEIKPYLFGAY